MKTLSYFIIIISVAAVTALWYFGFFTTLTFTEGRSPSTTLVYKKVIGKYENSTATQNELRSILIRQDSSLFPKPFAVYFDNPDSVSALKQRSITGCMVNGLDTTMARQLQGRFYVEKFAPPAILKTEFPFINEFSIILGIRQVYPKLMLEAKKRAYSTGPVMEIYNDYDNSIEYIITDSSYSKKLLEFLND